VEPVSAYEMADRLRQSLRKLLGWGGAYEPRILSERSKYDADLDEAEDLLDAAEAWIALHADRLHESDNA
jgi:hypothetical protein